MRKNELSDKKEYKITDEFVTEPRVRIGVLVDDLEKSGRFYRERLGCKILFESGSFTEMEFFGFLLTLYKNENARERNGSEKSSDPSSIAPYFGLTVGWEDWHRAVSHLGYIGTDFKVEPKIQCRGTDQEEGVFVLEDPSGNNLKFVALRKKNRGTDPDVLG